MRKTRQAFSLVLPLFALLLPSAAVAAKARGIKVEKWGRFFVADTPHYKIETDVSEDFTRETALHMESIYKEYSRQMRKFGSASGSKFAARVYQNKEDYLADVGEKYKNTGGLFIGSRKLLLAYRGDRPNDRVFATLYHEGFHQFMHLCVARRTPPWINEGLAEVFGGARWTGRGFKVGDVPPYRLRKLKSAFEDGTYIRLRDLVLVTGKEWSQTLADDAKRGGLQYAEAWSFIHFVAYAYRGKNMKRLGQCLKLLRNGQSNMEAFVGAFGSKTDLLEKKWIEYVNKLEPTPLYVCRQNIRLIGRLLAMLWSHLDHKALTMKCFFDAVTVPGRWNWWMEDGEGQRYTSKDVEAFTAWFRCPAYRSKRRSQLTYTFEQTAPNSPPNVLCLCHKGIVVKAVLKPSTTTGRYRTRVIEEIRQRGKRYGTRRR